MKEKGEEEKKKFIDSMAWHIQERQILRNKIDFFSILQIYNSFANFESLHSVFNIKTFIFISNVCYFAYLLLYISRVCRYLQDWFLFSWKEADTETLIFVILTYLSMFGLGEGEHPNIRLSPPTFHCTRDNVSNMILLSYLS